MTNVFISHAHADRKRADALAHELSQRGLSVWSSKEQLAPGEQWANAIEEGIRDAENFLVLLSSNSHKSEWLPVETALALTQQGKRVVPLLFSRNVQLPFMLKSFSGLDMSDQSSYRASVDRLATLLRERLPLNESGREKAGNTRARMAKLTASMLEQEKRLLETQEKLRKQALMGILGMCVAIFLGTGTVLLVTNAFDKLVAPIAALGGVVFGLAGSLLFLKRRSARDAEPDT